MPRDKDGDYEVGYGKLPRHTRFVKGQSGNPRGRPPGAKNLKTMLALGPNSLHIRTVTRTAIMSSSANSGVSAATSGATPGPTPSPAAARKAICWRCTRR
jgi:Family of unknown function (DUF5681)